MQISSSIVRWYTILLLVFVALATQVCGNKELVYFFVSFEFVLGLSLVSSNGRGITAYPSIFLILMYLFHGSYFFLWLLDYQIENVVVEFIAVPVWIQNAKFCVWFFCLYSIGVEMSSFVENRGSFPKTSVNGGYNPQKIGFVLAVLCIIPRLYIDVSKIIAYKRGGYLATFSSIEFGFLETLAQGFYYGLLFMMIGYRDDERKCRNLLAISLVFAIAGILSGRRQEIIVFIVTLFFVYYRYCRKKIYTKGDAWRNIKIFGAVFFLISVIATVGDLRQTGEISMETFLTMFLKNVSYELLFDQMSEFGYASFTLSASIEYFSEAGFGLGLNYLTSWLQIIPNIGGVHSLLTDTFSFVSFLPHYYQYWLGGSFLGEMFFNFGHYSYIFMFFTGFFFGKLGGLLDININIDRNYKLRFLVAILFIPLSFLWIRGDFTYIPRSLIWYTIMIIAVSRIKIEQFDNV